LDSQSRPYFQRATSVTRSGRTLDWTVEREWRFWGNVPLSELGPADAFLFVPTQAEALSLQEDSPWSVYVWQQ
ncbi:MAG: hypothetical protein KDB23_33990, partial [Planctomycetales bacterium]|nr:hypothetical protein [Planctomycetales bacterium]